MFINEALAAANDVAAMGGEGDFTKMLLQFGVILLVFYIFLIRPQSKKLKEHQQMIMGAEKGNKAVTQGGIIGRVVKAEETEVILEIAEGVKIRVLKEKLLSVGDFEKSDKMAMAAASSANDDSKPKKSDELKEILK